MSDFEHVLFYQVAALTFVLCGESLDRSGREWAWASTIAYVLSTVYAVVMVIWIVRDWT